MTIMDTEHLAAAELLYKLLDRMRDEARYPSHPAVRGRLTNAIVVLEIAAQQTASGIIDLDTADAIADAAELTLRQIIGIRKLRESVWPPNQTNGSGA